MRPDSGSSALARRTLAEPERVDELDVRAVLEQRVSDARVARWAAPRRPSEDRLGSSPTSPGRSCAACTSISSTGACRSSSTVRSKRDSTGSPSASVAPGSVTSGTGHAVRTPKRINRPRTGNCSSGIANTARVSSCQRATPAATANWVSGYRPSARAAGAVRVRHPGARLQRVERRRVRARQQHAAAREIVGRQRGVGELRGPAGVVEHGQPGEPRLARRTLRPRPWGRARRSGGRPGGRESRRCAAPPRRARRARRRGDRCRRTGARSTRRRPRARDDARWVRSRTGRPDRPWRSPPARKLPTAPGR